MKVLTDEITLTINLMQADIDDGAHSELQSHLYSLLEMKRNEIQKQLDERSLLEPATHVPSPYESFIELQDTPLSADELRSRHAVTPVTTEELNAGGWWCADTSNDALEAFISLGLQPSVVEVPWDGSFYGCFLCEHGSNLLDLGFKHHTEGKKQIHRVGNDFYWGEPPNPNNDK